MGHRRDWIISQNYTNPLCDAIRDRRLVVLHCLTGEGLVKEVVIVRRNENEDCLRDMSFEVYKTWFTRLTAILQTEYGSKGVALVLDNASNHSRRLKQIPTIVDTRNTMMAFVVQYKISFNETWTKKLLLQTVCRYTVGKEEDF